MRHFLFLLLLLVCISLKGQEYNKLVVEGNSWSFVNWTQGLDYTEYYVLKGDTTINSISYKKVFQTDDSTLQDLGWYRGALREDTVNKEVFLYGEYSGENKIYKFDLEIGDTAGIYSPSCGPMIISVVGLDTISDLAGKDRKRLQVDNYWSDDEYWIEGIGSLSGLLNAFNNECIADFNQEMLCFKNNNVLTYVNPIHNECYISSVNIFEAEKKNTKIDILPNPVTGTSEIIHCQDIEIRSYKAYDSNGQMISTSTQPIIEKRNNSPGVYFLIIETDNGDLLRTKFLIQ